MPVFITKINSASTDVTFEYLDSEAIWGLIVSATYDFDISDMSYTDGDDVLYEGIEALDQVYLQQNIVGKIGADEIRNGLVISIEYPESPNVGRTTASITIEERQKVSSHGALSDILDNVPSPHDVESFSETFSFERSENSYTRKRDVSLKYKQDAGHFFLNKARIFVQSMLFGSRPTFGYQEDGISENARFNTFFKPIITEKIDLLNKEVSFTESVETSNISSAGGVSYSKQSTHSLSIDKNGYTTKSYKASLLALNEPLEANILEAIKDFIQSTCNENSSEFNYPTAITKTINTDGGAAEVSINFTNDPSKNSITNISYRGSKSQQGEWNEYTFEIDIVSVGSNRIAAYNQTKNYWQNNIDVATTKIPILFPETVPQTLYEKSRSSTLSPIDRKITDKIIYTDNPQYNSSGNILKTSTTIKDTIGVQRHSLSPIVGDRTLIQKRNNAKNVSTRSINVQLVSKNFQSLESQALSIAETNQPSSTYKYIDSKTSTYNPSDGTSSASVNYIYFD